MLDRRYLTIPELIRARKPGYTLPADMYHRQDVFEADIAICFGQQWIYVGLEIEIPEAGDVLVFDVGPSSVIILRDEDESLRAFHNVCRHRGARLRDTGKGTVGKLVCPYHQWTYELNGDLLHATHMGKDFDPSCHGLRKVHLQVVAGLLFVCFAEEPPADFTTFREVMTPRLADYDLKNVKIAFEKDIIEEGNWKLTMENNRECYHCAGSHPELGVSFLSIDFGFDPEELSEEQRREAAAHQREFARRTKEWEAQGLPSTGFDHLAGHVTNFRTERLMMGEGGRVESATLDGKIASKKLLGQLVRTDIGDTHLWTHHSWHHYMADHAVISFAIPIAPGRTRVRTVWLVHKDAVEGVDYDLENLTVVWKATNAQDAGLVGRAYQGVCSPGYQPGPYSPFTETYLDGFATWYIERLQAAGY